MTVGDEIGALLAQVAKGDRRAFRKVYDTISPRLFGLCFGIVKDESIAEEVLCVVFDRIWNWAGQMHPNGTTGTTWLITLTRDASVERLRQMREAGLIDEPIDIAERLYHRSKRSTAQSEDEAAAFRQCLADVPPDRVEVMRAAYLQGLTYHDQAALTGGDATALRTEIRRSVLQVRACLSQ